MNGNHLLEVQSLLRHNGVLISFSGRLSQQLIEEYGEAVKTYLETDNRPKNEVHSIFSIFIEQTQNIKNYCTSQRHRPDYERIAQSSIVTIGKNDRGVFICSGNLVAARELEPLAAGIEALVRLGKDELKKLYKDKLRQPLPEGAQGAGVGLIDIARKATLPLEYSVVPVDGDLSFFSLKAVV